MIRRFLRVARPADWTGGFARAGVIAFGALLWLYAILGRLPPGLRDLQPSWLVRLSLLLVIYFVVRELAAIPYALLPQSAFLFRGQVAVRIRGKRVKIDVGDIREVHVDERPEPQREVFVLELLDMREFDLCPVHWDGAERIFAVLRRKVERDKAARRKRRRKTKKKGASQRTNHRGGGDGGGKAPGGRSKSGEIKARRSKSGDKSGDKSPTKS